jgi:hypothetical protein
MRFDTWLGLLPGSALAGLLAMASTAPVQDLVSVAPNAATVEYEDARIRVVRLRMAANTSSAMHDRPRRVVIPLTENDVRITRENGAVGTTQVPAHRVAWSEPGTRSVANLDKPLENVIVELKTATAPGVPLPAPPSPVPPDYLTEPHHRWLFENQYVRVYDVRIPPGVTTDFHRHALDAVVVRISSGVVATQRQGEAWSEPARVSAGEAVVDLDSKVPFMHRVRNHGTAEYRVILVQLK